MDTLQGLKTRLNNTKNFYHSQKGELDNINKEARLKEDEIASLKKDYEKLNVEKKLIDDACTEAREEGRQFSEEIATAGATAVFKDDTKVKLSIEEKGNAPVLDISVTKKDENGVEQFVDPNMDGGGLDDALSLCFLISIGSTVESNYAPYVLDEPSKYISKGNYASNFADYMRDIATFTNKQIIMSTHDEAMLDIGNTRYSIRMNPLTKVSEITKEY
jgi:hypothetical protein